MLPLPSQIELSGACRYSRGRMDSSTYPAPPKHSCASLTKAGARLQIQYLPAAVAMRANAASPASCGAASTARATRSANTSAASASSARSASTLRIRACATKGLPNARRWCAWCNACASAMRISAAEPSMQSRRVSMTISMMVATPRPSSPTRQACAPVNSTSLEAFDPSPSLSFSRISRNAFRSPSSRRRGIRKQLSPAGACASTRKPSHIGAEKNHLCPTNA